MNIEKIYKHGMDINHTHLYMLKFREILLTELLNIPQITAELSPHSIDLGNMTKVQAFEAQTGPPGYFSSKVVLQSGLLGADPLFMKVTRYLRPDGFSHDSPTQ